jgi:hypothetical protein
MAAESEAQPTIVDVEIAPRKSAKRFAAVSQRVLNRNLMRQQAVQDGEEEAGEHHGGGRAELFDLDHASLATPGLRLCGPRLLLRLGDKAMSIHIANLAHDAALCGSR